MVIFETKSTSYSLQLNAFAPNIGSLCILPFSRHSNSLARATLASTSLARTSLVRTSIARTSLARTSLVRTSIARTSLVRTTHFQH